MAQRQGSGLSDGSQRPVAAGPQLRADELEQLSTVFTPRPWLRDLGFSSWYLVGVILLLVGLVWLWEPR